tara:strand:- start:250 stop:1014 length:765 start_codon:yes stop_codon:yes gene_type:complete
MAQIQYQRDLARTIHLGDLAEVKRVVLQQLKLEMQGLEVVDLAGRVAQVFLPGAVLGSELLPLHRVFYSLDLGASAPKAVVDRLVDGELVMQALDETGLSDVLLRGTVATPQAKHEAPRAVEAPEAVEEVDTKQMVPQQLHKLLYPVDQTPILGAKRPAPKVDHVVDIDGDSDEPDACPWAPKKARAHKSRTKTVTFSDDVAVHEIPLYVDTPEVAQFQRAVDLRPGVLQLIVEGSMEENMSVEEIAEVLRQGA